VLERNATPRRDQRQQASRLIDRAEVQQLLGVSRATLWRIVRDGALPVVEIDGRVRFMWEDVERFIRSRRTWRRP
jgi:excisionase family DNA binding protein